MHSPSLQRDQFSRYNSRIWKSVDFCQLHRWPSNLLHCNLLTFLWNRKYQVRLVQ